MTAIAVAHGVPYAAQAAGSHWHDLSLKAERGAAADGPAFLSVLSDCPLGWGHEPRLSKRVLDAAVDSCFWPLYEVSDGHHRLTYRPEKIAPVEEWLRPQARFAHLLEPANSGLVERIQRRIDADWAALLSRCGE
jgi:pyruvate ferredoxin oxidoreductase beta subunit